MSGYKFDYEKKVWGGEVLRLSPIHFRASRLLYVLKTLKSVRGNGSISSPPRVLDVGCGVGDVSEAIRHYRPDLEIYGIDISKKAIGKAKARKLAASFIVADVQKLPFPNEYFEAVICLDLIEHVRYPDKALKEIARVLKPGAAFHVFFPTEDNVYTPEGLLIRLGWKGKEKYGGHPRTFSPKQAKKMLADSGFQIIKSRWGDHFIHQACEIVYFSLLAIRKKNAEHTVEGYLAQAKPSMGVFLLQFIKNTLSTLSFLETMALFWFPGLGLHLTCRKR